MRSMAIVVLITMVMAGLLFASSTSIAQQQATPTTPQSASCPGPPLDTPVHSTSEDGQSGFTIVYHADGTLDLKVFTETCLGEAKVPFTYTWDGETTTAGGL